jgi:DNA-binding NarL/FixJ family response regulator
MTKLTSKTRVLVMHDEQLVDAGLAATLARQGDIDVLQPCSASKIETVLNWLFTHEADILITDYERGVAMAAALQRTQVPFRSVRPHLLIVTGRTTQAEIRNALKNGINGYLTNTCPAHEIVEAVRSVQLGRRHVSEPLAKSLLDDFLGEQLTPRESEVLSLAALGYANKVIAARLEVELGTVKCHMRAILDKLGADNRTEAVVIAHRRGLLALEPAASPATTRASSPRLFAQASGERTAKVLAFA